MARERKRPSLFVVVYVDYGETCDGFGDVLCTKDTLEAAAEEMLADYRDREAENPGYFKAKYTSKTAEIWYDEEQSSGCTWKVVEL